ncbi:uncharacterized protein [Penaeus vannamei]
MYPTMLRVQTRESPSQTKRAAYETQGIGPPLRREQGRTATARVLKVAISEGRFMKFDKEFQILGLLNGAGGAPLPLSFIENPLSFIMTYKGPITLHDALHDWTWRDEDILEICLNVCRRVTEVHRKGIAHNDLKKDNVIVTPDNDVSIIDYGNGARLGDCFCYAGSGGSGGCRWIAPEMYERHPLTVKSDVYSVGVILFDMYQRAKSFPEYPRVIDEALHEDPDRRPSLETVMQYL